MCSTRRNLFPTWDLRPYVNAIRFLPVDVASYIADPKADQSSTPNLLYLLSFFRKDQEPDVRFTILWVASAGTGEDARLFLELTSDNPEDDHKSFEKEKNYFALLTLHERASESQEYRINQVWRRSDTHDTQESSFCHGYYESEYEGMLNPSDLQMDICITRQPKPPTDVNPFADVINVPESKIPELFRTIAVPLARGIEDFGHAKDQEAIEQLSIAFSKFPILPHPFFFRSMAHARLGHGDKAKEDLAQARKITAQLSEFSDDFEFRLTTKTWLAYTDAIVSAYLKDEDAGILRLESFVTENRKNGDVLTTAARAYAAAAAIVAPPPKEPGFWTPSNTREVETRAAKPATERIGKAKRYADRAVALLNEAVDHGHIFPWWLLETHPDLDAIRELPGFRGLMNRIHIDRRYSAVWHKSVRDREGQELHGLAPGPHLRRCRELAAQGYRPAAISVASIAQDQPLVAASVWHRPVIPEDARDTLARRQANAALVLLDLGQVDPVWPLLHHAPDSRLRTYLIHQIGPYGIDPQVLIERLEDESDVSARRALILALGEYPDEHLSPGAREPLVANLLLAYRDDPDPGIHSAIDWLLRRWKNEDERRRIRKQIASQRPEGNRLWYVNGQEQTLAIVRGPVEFLMGSPGHEVDRETDEEIHRRRIKRTFAIATTETTVEQFLRFRCDHLYPRAQPEAGRADRPGELAPGGAVLPVAEREGGNTGGADVLPTPGPDRPRHDPPGRLPVSDGLPPPDGGRVGVRMPSRGSHLPSLWR